MGLNIGLYNLAGVKDITYPWPDIVSDERFDFLRYSGDKEFVTWLAQDDNGEFKSLGSEWSWECYERPRDLQQARAWVKANIVEDNQQRWLDLFDWLEADTEKALWLQEHW